MPHSKTKRKQDKWMPAVIASLILIGLAIWVSILLPTEDAPADNARVNESTAAFVTQTLGIWEGQLARFEGDGGQPAEIYDVAVASLPAEMQQQLESGIVVTSEEQLISLLENLTS